MTFTTEDLIKTNAKQLFTRAGYEGFSMRNLSKQSGVSLSSVYHFFKDKDQLLHTIFEETRLSLGRERSKMYTPASASDMLKQRIIFQFHHIDDVVFLIKYYLHFRAYVMTSESTYSTENTFKHIKEVLIAGQESEEFNISPESIDEHSKVITHAINGFLLEYYPTPPTGQELRDLIDSIHDFLLPRLCHGKEVPMS